MSTWSRGQEKGARHFNAPFAGSWEDVRRLFDSIVKGYPIGNLLLWKRPAMAETVRLGSLHIEASQLDEAWWVVDGQQRIISLANALSVVGAQNERFALAYDLHKKDFVRPPTLDEGHIIPLPVLFDLQRLIRWFSKDHPEAGEDLDEASNITRAIREYNVPTYLVVQNDEKILRDIFDRLNDYGKRLTKPEVFHALHSLESSDNAGQISRFQRIAESVHSKHAFGIIEDNTVMRALLARRGADITRDIRYEFSGERTRKPRDFKDESETAFYDNGMDALSRAIQFLQEDAHVPHFNFLPYRHLLVVLTRFFAHFPQPHVRNRTLLRRWFWRAALTGLAPFDANWNKAALELCACIPAHGENDAVQKLIEKIPSSGSMTAPRLTDFRPHWAEGRIILCALWSLSPQSPFSGNSYDRKQLADAIDTDTSTRAVLPKILLSEPRHHRYLAANRILLLEEEVADAVAATLTVCRTSLTDKWPAFLASHALSETLIQQLSQNEAVNFLEGRQQLITEAVKRFIARMTETEFEDPPPAG